MTKEKKVSEEKPAQEKKPNPDPRPAEPWGRKPLESKKEKK